MSRVVSKRALAAIERSVAGARRLVCCAVAVLATACGSGGDSGVVALFELPSDGVTPSGFYGLPFPNDLRLAADGSIDLSEHVRPNDLIDFYLDELAPRTHGFGLNSAAFARFDDLIDPESLPPSPEASLLADASVYLVNVDRASPQLGERIPLLFRFSQWPGESIGANWLGCLPYPGFPLRQSTTYALVVTERLRGLDGTPVVRSSDFDAVMGSGSDDAEIARAQEIYEPLLEWLDQDGDDERGDVVSAAVFTTQDATSLLGRAREVIRRDVAAPVARDVGLTSSNSSYLLYEGVYDAPNFQTGEPPYRRPEDGGEILLDETTGEPVVQRMEALRFAVTVPNQEMPASGWPVILYAHGTGGDYKSFVANQTAARLAAEDLAVISIDQPLHGTRSPPGSSTEEAFFNYQNPVAGRDNVRQGAIDDFQLLRLVSSLVLEEDAPGGTPIVFDADHIGFMGHSQGGLTGSLFVPYEPLIVGAVLSGAGGDLYQSLLLKEGFADLVSVIIRDYPLDQFNNLLALVQTFAESSDPINYGPLMVGEPPQGGTAKDIYQSEGFVDSYTPPLTIEALGVAIGLSPVTPVLQPVHGFELRGIGAVDPPVEGNRDGHTAGFLQYDAAPGEDGHFVVFDVADARRHVAFFLHTLAYEGRATIVP